MLLRCIISVITILLLSSNYFSFVANSFSNPSPTAREKLRIETDDDASDDSVTGLELAASVCLCCCEWPCQ